MTWAGALGGLAGGLARSMRSLPLGARLVVLLVALTLTINLAWALVIPYGWGDDEPAHAFSYEYLSRSIAIPIITEDPEAIFYSSGSALFSYLAYPPLPYLPTAATLWVLGIDDQDGSIAAGRAWSAIWVSVAVLMAYATTRRLVPGGRGAHAAFWAGAVVALLPKMGEIGGYANSDSLAIAAAAVLGWLTVTAHQRGWNARWSTAVAVGISALFFTRYNAYLAALPTVTLIGYSWVTTRRPSLRSLALMAGLVLVVWGWWPVRNLLLYGEPTGVPTLYAGLIERGTPQVLASSVFGVPDSFAALITQTPWVGDTWASVWLGEKAGGQGVWLWLLTATLVIVVLYATWRGWRDRRTGGTSQLGPLALGLLLATVLIGFLTAYNSIAYDYQAKGRYLLPLVPLGTALLAYTISRFPDRPRALAMLLVPSVVGASSVAYAVGFFIPVAILRY